MKTIADQIAEWPADLRDDYEERVAILVVDSKLSQSDAEEKAYNMLAPRALEGRINMNDKILGLTLHEPWASLVARGLKPIENRRWTPPVKWIEASGWLALHAGKTYDTECAPWVRARFPELQIPVEPKNGIIAVARVVGWLEPKTGNVVMIHKLALPPTDAEKLWHMRDQFGWILRDLVLLPTPIECRGMQKLWPLGSAYAQVREAFGAATRAA